MFSGDMIASIMIEDVKTTGKFLGVAALALGVAAISIFYWWGGC